MHNKNIKHYLITFILICILLSSPVILSIHSNEKTITEFSTSNGMGKTLIMGNIVNPIEENGTYTTKALQVFYYEPGILFSEGGIVKRFATITFSDDPFLFVWTPGPFEIFGYVFGITSEFEVL